MRKEELKQSGVVFDAEHHTYELGGLPLSGITPIISWLFPDTYKGIPKAVLDKAAEHGHGVHEAIQELDDSEWKVASAEYMKECQDYMDLMGMKGLVPIASEYIVSDGQSIASAIDKVFDDNSIGDIKTTSKVHIPNVTMQLSIYAWLFEKQNQDKKVGKLYCIWLPKPEYGTADIIELKRVSPDVVRAVIDMYVKGGDYEVARTLLTATGFNFEKQRMTSDIPDGVQPLIDELMVVKQQLDIYTEREKEIKAQLLEVMQERGEDKWSNDLIQFSRRAASTRITIDSKLLKEKDPDLYDECAKVTNVKESLTYKVL